MNEYQISRSRRIFIGICASVVAVFFLSMAVMASLAEISWPLRLVSMIFLLSLTAVIVRAVVLSASLRFGITDAKIYCRTAFGYRELALSEIKGYHRKNAQLEIEAQRPDCPKIKLPYYLEGFDTVMDWLQSRYPDLGLAKYAAQQTAVLDDPAFGNNRNERAVWLNKARGVARAANWLAGFVLVWAIVFWDEVVVFLAVLAPVAAMVVVHWGKGAILLVRREDRLKPDVGWLFVAPPIVVTLRICVASRFLDYGDFVLPYMICCLLLGLAMRFWGRTGFGRANDCFVLPRKLFCWGLLLLHAWGCTLAVNALGPEQLVGQSVVTVVGKHETKGQSVPNFYVALAPWRKYNHPWNVKVARSFYDETRLGAMLPIEIRRGCLGIQWIEMSWEQREFK